MCLQCAGTPLSLPLKRITWKEAMERYGSDKPDTRFEMHIQDVSETVNNCGFSVFESAVDAGNIVCGITAKGKADNLSRKNIDALTDYAKTYHVKGLAWYAINSDGTIRSSFAKFMSDESLNKLISDMDCKTGDIMFFIADKRITALTAMGQLRLKLGKDLDLIDTSRNDLFWVTEFPLFEYSEEDQRYVAAHHPFTMPMDEDFDLIDTNPHIMRAKSYDLVMNGIEMGSGSIRIHSSDIQERMFNMLGFTKEEAWKRFGSCLKPSNTEHPHGGLPWYRQAYNGAQRKRKP